MPSVFVNDPHKKPRFNLSCFSNHKKFRIADIGGNLNIESLQDTSTYASQQQSLSISATGGAGANVSRPTVQSNFLV